MKYFLNHEWNLLEKQLIIATCFMSGIIIGFMFAPIKRGIYCGNHNGNTDITRD
ncbi:hypothetical protein [Lacrimispora sp.]|uniref:hypothetical protein n=1 Tax=Lacrimispora sp. TaxID=2719234 RepID=UPI0039923CD4